jgi:hypothetical protein
MLNEQIKSIADRELEAIKMNAKGTSLGASLEVDANSNFLYSSLVATLKDGLSVMTGASVSVIEKADSIADLLDTATAVVPATEPAEA